MSMTVAAPSATQRDVRTFRRVVAAILLPIGPLSVAILRGILPYFHATDARATIDQTAGHLGRQDAVLWLTVVAIFTLIPSSLAAGRLAQRGAPVLSLLGVGLLVPSFAMLPFFASDQTIRALAGGAVDPASAAAVLDAQNALAPLSLAGGVFVLGHVVGVVLIGAALWRARAIPVWAAVLVVVSQPLHFAAFIIIGSQPLDACAWALTALGLGVASARVLRTSNDAWDVGAVAR